MTTSGLSGTPPSTRPIWTLACLLAALLALAVPASARTARDEPVAIGGPAWQALMARPAADAETTAFYAADLLAAWHRPAEADTLRRALLARHLRAAGGEAVTPATLDEVWRAGTVAPGELTALHAKAAQRQPGASWAGLAPASDEAVRHLVERIGNRPPPDLHDFVRTWDGCRGAGPCRHPAARAAAQTDAERDAERDARITARALESEQRWREQQREARESQRRSERLLTAVLAAYTLGGLLVHLLVARYAGKVLAVIATLALGPLLTVLAYLHWGVGSGWGGLAMLVFYAGLAFSGLPLAPLYAWVHKTWFGGREGR